MNAKIAILVTGLILAAALSAAPGTPGAAGTAQPEHRNFARGIAGTAPPDRADQPAVYFDRPEVRAVLARMEAGPLQPDGIEAMLAGTPTRLNDLVRLGLIRAGPRGYSIGFSYFTLDDMRRIHASAERHVPALIAAYRRWRGVFDRELRRYPVAGVDHRTLGYVLLAGVALNWDALRQIRALGYRRPLLREGPGWRYSFW